MKLSNSQFDRIREKLAESDYIVGHPIRVLPSDFGHSILITRIDNFAFSLVEGESEAIGIGILPLPVTNPWFQSLSKYLTARRLAKIQADCMALEIGDYFAVRESETAVRFYAPAWKKYGHEPWEY
jgi:hypothetical protein